MKSLKYSKVDILLWINVSIILQSKNSSFQREKLMLSPFGEEMETSSSGRFQKCKNSYIVGMGSFC